MSAENVSFKAGFARVDIPPDKPVPLDGYGNSLRRYNKTVRNPLYASRI